MDGMIIVRLLEIENIVKSNIKPDHSQYHQITDNQPGDKSTKTVPGCCNVPNVTIIAGINIKKDEKQRDRHGG